MIGRRSVVWKWKVGQHCVCEEGATSTAAAARERMSDLVAPGERPELIAPLARRAQEGDADVVDRNGVGAELSGDLARRQRPRALLQGVGLLRQPQPKLGRKPEPLAGMRRAAEGDQLRLPQSTQHLQLS